MPIINQIAEYYNEMKTWRLQKDINLVGYKISGAIKLLNLYLIF